MRAPWWSWRIGTAQALGPAALAVTCDVTDTGSANAAMDSAVEAFGGLDVLVNNAGGSLGRDFPNAEPEAWLEQLDLSLAGAVRCIRAALPYLLASQAGGSVVNIGSVNGLAGFGDEPYSAVKAALVNLTESMAIRYGAHLAGPESKGVRINLIDPARSVHMSGMTSSIH